MTLCKGYHVVIKRNDKILTEQDEAYHEFEVITPPEIATDIFKEYGKPIYRVFLEVVK